MSEHSVLDQVRHLVKLQKIDALIYQFRRELKEKPALLMKLKEDFETKKNLLKELEEKYKHVQVKRKEYEGDLKSNEDAISKANMQLSQIKTNKEYMAKISEIENIKADKSITEEKILLSFDEGDDVKAAVEKEKEVLATEENKYAGLKKEIDEIINELGAKVTRLEEESARVTPLIEKAYLDRYEKILVNKDGLAIVPVQSGVCGGCFMNIPDQVVNEIKMHDKLVLCELCARILYLEEDIEAS